MEQRLDQHSFAAACVHRTGYTGQRKIIRGGQFLYQATDRKGLLDVYLRFQVSRPLDHCLQPPAEPSGRIRSEAEILCNQFRRSATVAPLQPHPSRLHGGYYRRLRECLYDNVKFEQNVGAKAGRLLRRIAHNPLCSNYLVSQNLPEREILHFPARCRVPEPPLRGYFSDSLLISRTRKLPLALYGRMARWGGGAVAGPDRIGQNTAFAYDFAAALLGHVRQRVYPRHQQSAGAENPLRRKQSRQAKHLRRGVGIVQFAHRQAR